MADITFNKLYAGYIYSGTGMVYHQRDDGGFNGVSVSLDDEAQPTKYVATGLTTTAKDGSLMLQIEGEAYHNWIDASSGEWTRGSLANIYSQWQAQDYVNKLIENNKQILMNNLLCARFASHLSAEEKQLLYDLEARLYDRNQHLVTDGFVTSRSDSEAYGYGELSQYLKDFMRNGVGLVISSTAIVISCVVVASLATAAYFAYKYYYEQSARDVKYSDKLTKTLLSKLTQEEYNQLMAETKGIVTKASIRARLGSVWDIAKLAALAFGAYTLYQLFTIKTAKRHGTSKNTKA